MLIILYSLCTVQVRLVGGGMASPAPPLATGLVKYVNDLGKTFLDYVVVSLH